MKTTAYGSLDPRLLTINKGLLQFKDDPERMARTQDQNNREILLRLGKLVGTSGSIVLTTTDIAEGTNLYYTAERVDDRVDALIQDGTGITWVYDDAGGTLTPTVTITQYTNEMAQDTVAGMIQNNTGISWAYDDALGTLTPTITFPAVAHDILSATHSDSLAGAAVLGGVLYANATPKWAQLAGNTTTSKFFLSQTGTGLVSAVPAWSAVSKSDVGLGSVTNDAQVKISDFAAKGNLLAGTGAGTFASLAVGANDYILVADSTQASGVRWAAQAGIKYIDRGDPAVYDYTLASFTTDGTYRDLDLSAIVPAIAANQLVHMRIEITDNALGAVFAVIEKGNLNDHNALATTTLALNERTILDGFVLMDSNRVIQYMGANTVFTAINAVVRGWFEPSSGVAGGGVTAHYALTNLDYATAGHTGFQQANSNLTSLAALAYASASFVKMTAANTFTLDTNTYLTSVTAHNLLSATHGDTTAGAAVLGGLVYADATPKWVQLAGNTTVTKKVLTQTGTGAVSAVPVWGTIVEGVANPVTSDAVLAQYKLTMGSDGTRKVQDSQILTDANGNLILPASAGYRMKNPAGTFYTELKSAAVAANKSWTLPLIDGSVNQALITNASAVLSFANMGFQRIYYDELSAAATTFTVSTLDGDTDKLYIIIFAGVGGHAAGTADYFIRPNDDSGTNYGIRWDQNGATGSATNMTGLYPAQGLDPGNIGLSISWLHAVTGINRRMVAVGIDRSTGETVGFLGLVGSLWNNSADNITSIAFTASIASGFGIGSTIAIWRQI